MTVNQASVAQEQLQWGLMPDNWSDLVKRDYQEKTNGLNDVAEVANEANRTASNEANKNETQDKAIELNRKNILDTSTKVSVLGQSVSKNATAIGDNKQATETNAENLKTHEGLNSAHGVKGDNVGTEDFAQELVGGVVLMAEKLAELEALTLNIPDAPGEYNQEYMQTVANGINSLVSKQSDIITLLNQVISTQVTAKQRAQNADVSND